MEKCQTLKFRSRLILPIGLAKFILGQYLILCRKTGPLYFLIFFSKSLFAQSSQENWGEDTLPLVESLGKEEGFS